MASKHINIQYPFRDSSNGFYIDLNDTKEKAIKADLLHLILTRRGQRLYKPDFGTDLLRYIFEPNDGVSLEAVKEEIVTTVQKYLPNLSIKNISVDPSLENDYVAVVRLDYTINDDVFEINDFVVINI